MRNDKRPTINDKLKTENRKPKTKNEIGTRWLFAVKILDKPGALTAVASVFSNRGVSLQMILGSVLAGSEDGSSTLLVNFEASEAKMRTLQRTIGRLSKVLAVQSYPYDSIHLRAIAIAQVPREIALQIEPEEKVEFIRIASSECSETLLVHGSPLSVEGFLTQLRESKHLQGATLIVAPVAIE